MKDQIEIKLAPVNAPPIAGQLPPEYKPPEKELWSIPQVITDTYTGLIIPDKDEALRVRQGVVLEVAIAGVSPAGGASAYYIQNINENEDDIIEWSFHGVPDGIWSKLMPANLILTNRSIFFLNRTNKDVLYLAVSNVRKS